MSKVKDGDLCDPSFKFVHGVNVYDVWDSTRPSGRRNVVDTYFDPLVEPSLTQQQFKDDCDVNVIMDRFLKTGEVTHLNSNPGVYADLTGIGDYTDMLMRVKAAESAFSQLPHQIKTKFEQDPSKLIAYLEDPKNLEESYALGLRVKPEAPAPNPVVEELKGLRSDMRPKKKVVVEVPDEG